MLHCPKCGVNSSEIHGPYYCKGGFRCLHGSLREHMTYNCGRCGYVQSTPTLDQQRTASQTLQQTS